MSWLNKQLNNQEAYDWSKNHPVKFEAVKLVAGESFLNVWLDFRFDQVSSEHVCVRPDLFKDSVQPLASLNIREENPSW